MMRKIFLLLFFSLFLFLNNILAQDAPRDDKNKNDADTLVVMRQKSMDDEIRNLISQRDSLMEEEITTILRKREAGKLLYDLRSMKSDAFGQPVEMKKSPGEGGIFTIKNTSNALDFNFESETEERKLSSAALPTRRSRLLFEEALETSFAGSVYHPNFISFDADLEAGLSQNKEKFQPNLSGKLKNSGLSQYHIVSSFLEKKPYAFSLSADKSREVQNREFFERQVINADKYGGSFGYRNGFLPLGFSFSNSDKKIDRISRPSQDFRDDELSLNLSNESGFFGETFFDANQDTFSRAELGTADQHGVSKEINLTNKKYFSEDERKMLYSSLRSYDLTGTNDSSVLALNEDFDIKHTDYLSSSYDYSFSDKSSSGVKAKDNRIGASLQHRLYESLNSAFSTYYFNSKATSFSEDSYGLSINESYQKKLGRIGRFSSGAGVAYSEDKRKTVDNIISTIDESHTLTTGNITFLDMPRVDTLTVLVTNAAGDITYIRNIDYLLTAIGERTQIQRIPGGSIPDGSIVSVDYQAASSPTIKFNTISEDYNARMDFLEQMFGVFYNLSRESHPRVSAGQGLILQKLKDTTVGLDFRYKNFSVELSSEYYDSNLSSYKQNRIKESFFVNPTEGSTLTFDSSQYKVRLIDSQEIQKFFDFVSRYVIRLNDYSRLDCEAGFRWQEGTGIDLDDITAASGYELNLNKFSLNLKYEFQRQLYLNDKLINHFFSFKIKRLF